MSVVQRTLLPTTGTESPVGAGRVRKMLEDMGVTVVEVDGLCRAAWWVEDANVLLIRPAASPAVWAKAAELVLLDQVPAQRVPHRQDELRRGPDR